MGANKKTNKKLWEKQIQLQERMQENGMNLVTCGNCGTVIIHDLKSDDVECHECNGTYDSSDCPDIFYVGMQIPEEKKELNEMYEGWTYTPENSDEALSKSDFIKIAKGNAEYARLLMDRVTWQHPETLVQEDLASGEIEEVNGTYVIINQE